MHTRERAVLLEGLIVEGGNGCSRAASLARRHLVALGCRPATTDAVWPRHPQADPSRGAEWIALGSGNASGCRHVVECSIDAAGPVRLPLEDETMVQAACGVMHVHGRKSGRPEPLFVDYVSAVSGVLAVQGLLAGFLARLRGAEFARVSTSLAQAALLTVSQYLAAATADESAERFNVGGPPFISLDGVRFEIEALEAGGWRAFWGLFDVDPGAVARGWRPFRDRYSTATCPLPIELHSGAERRPFSEILSCAKIAGISAVAVSGLTDVRGSEGPDRPTEPPWQFASGEGFAPPLGILPPGAPLPLQGLTVVESARRIQGPLAAHVLARLGARVIRIEPPGGDPMRGMPPLVDGCSARFLIVRGRGDSGRRLSAQLDGRDGRGPGPRLRALGIFEARARLRSRVGLGRRFWFRPSSGNGLPCPGSQWPGGGRTAAGRLARAFVDDAHRRAGGTHFGAGGSRSPGGEAADPAWMQG